MDTPIKNYNRTSRLIHWLSAVTVIPMFALGLWMMTLTYYSEWYKLAPFWHKSIGMTLFGLTLYRIFWNLLTKSPTVVGKSYERIAAKLVHGIMYLLLILLFLSGYLISTEDGRGIDIFGWFLIPGMGALFKGQADIAGLVHYYIACILIGIVVLHVIAALKHHYIDKDNTLTKMIGKVR